VILRHHSHRAFPGALLRLGLLVAGLAAITACSYKASQKNISRGPVDTGPGSLADMRAQLKGTWVLQEMKVRNGSGQLQPVRAQATLDCDDFGNVKVNGALLEALPQSQPGTTDHVLAYTGRIVIDTAKQEFRLDNPEAAAPVDPGLASTVGPSLVRKFEITGNQLHVRFVDPSGAVTAETTFQRR
jgi:hypothetical protein